MACGMRPKKFTGLDKDWQEWEFQLNVYVAVISVTMSADIRTAENMTNPQCSASTKHRWQTRDSWPGYGEVAAVEQQEWCSAVSGARTVLEACRRKCILCESTSGQNALDTLETNFSFKTSGRQDDVECEIGRCELAADDYERIVQPVLITDEITISRIVRSLPPARCEQVEHNQHTRKVGYLPGPTSMSVSRRLFCRLWADHADIAVPSWWRRRDSRMVTSDWQRVSHHRVMRATRNSLTKSLGEAISWQRIAEKQSWWKRTHWTILGRNVRCYRKLDKPSCKTRSTWM